MALKGLVWPPHKFTLQIASTVIDAGLNLIYGGRQPKRLQCMSAEPHSGESVVPLCHNKQKLFAHHKAPYVVLL